MPKPTKVKLKKKKTDADILTRLATPIIPSEEKKKAPKTKTKKRQTKLSKSEKRRREELSKKKVMDNINNEILNLAAIEEPRFKSSLDARIEKSRKFLLEEIAPLSLGVEAGLANGLSILEELTNGKQSSKFVRTAQTMLETAMKLKLSEYIGSTFGLSPEDVKKVYDATVPKQPSTSILTMPALTDVKKEKP